MTAATVSGRRYQRTRVRGLAPWTPTARSAALLAAVYGVLEEYRQWWPLTCRQLYYRLVAAEVLDKTEAAYSRLAETLNRARRAGLIEWSAVRDDGTVSLGIACFDDPADFRGHVTAEARRYRVDRQAAQLRRVEVWVESAGMAPQIARAVEPYGVSVYSSGGFVSTTARHDAACRVIADGRPFTLLQVGDHDPSGLSVVDSLAADLAALVADLGGSHPVEVARVAITPAQADERGAPSAPQKSTDRRGAHMAETWQCEALPPDALAAIVRAAVTDRVDATRHAATLDREDAERDALIEWVTR